ncbi:hypothetical protein FD755_006638 [Muntiacus reevesi]|uniref:Retroviral envelope protein GP41-like domain-containing protein n=1 Tax=Muntiacus reevesi TaxID=9886 RepID=A0A5J5MVX8_MUNRE|nr:hypothetical protein FD755_006638 [Muntiacus reevesi]
MLIAAILGIIAITTTTAVARIALHQSVHFVQEWHKDADVLWSTQQKIEEKLASQVADLQQSVILLGGQLVSLQKQLRLKCDWNYTSFFKLHLLNQGNITLDIQELQCDILDTFNKKLDVITGSSLFNAIAKGVPSLNPFKQIKSYGYGLISSCSVLLIILFCLCIVEKNKKEAAATVSLLDYSVIYKNKKGEIFN